MHKRLWGTDLPRIEVIVNFTPFVHATRGAATVPRQSRYRLTYPTFPACSAAPAPPDPLRIYPHNVMYYEEERSGERLGNQLVEIQKSHRNQVEIWKSANHVESGEITRGKSGSRVATSKRGVVRMRGARKRCYRFHCSVLVQRSRYVNFH